MILTKFDLPVRAGRHVVGASFRRGTQRFGQPTQCSAAKAPSWPLVPPGLQHAQARQRPFPVPPAPFSSQLGASRQPQHRGIASPYHAARSR